MASTKELKLGTTYRVTESFTTPVLDGHEIGGVWSEHASVALDPGEEFRVVNGRWRSPKEEYRGSHWLIAEMKHPLRFEIEGDRVTWKGRFYVSESLHGDKIEEVK